MSTGTEIVITAPKPVTEMARKAWNQEQVAVIRDTVAKDCSPAELHMFLEIAAKHNLDPFLGQIYAAKMGSQDGSGGRVTIMVPRDGFLAKAQEHPDFEGMEGDVVREKDQFKVTSAGGERTVEHTFEGSAKTRGAIVGAWAVVHRTGRKPTFFYAPLDEYKPTSGRKLQYSPWGRQESAMILKCAESMCLRKAFSITGVAGAEEMQKQLVEGISVEVGDDPYAAVEDESLREQIRACVAAINETEEGSWKPAKVRVALRGKSEDKHREFLAGLHEELLALDLEIPGPPDEAQAEEDEEKIEDAQVVEDEILCVEDADENAFRYAHVGAEDCEARWIVPHDGMEPPKGEYECPGCAQTVPVRMVDELPS